MVYGIRPSPESCCIYCKYFNIENLWCSNLNKHVAWTSLCPDITDIPIEVVNERKEYIFKRWEKLKEKSPDKDLWWGL